VEVPWKDEELAPQISQRDAEKTPGELQDALFSLWAVSGSIIFRNLGNTAVPSQIESICEGAIAKEMPKETKLLLRPLRCFGRRVVDEELWWKFLGSRSFSEGTSTWRLRWSFALPLNPVFLVVANFKGGCDARP